MDPLTVTTSIIALISAIGNTLSLLQDARSRFQSAEDDYDRLQDELTAFDVLVQQLHQLTSNHKGQQSNLHALEKVLRPCELTLREIQAEVENISLGRPNK